MAIYIYYSKFQKHQESHQLLAVAARQYVLEQQAMGRLSEVDPYGTDWSVQEGEHGKPVFLEHPKICFSISHSEDLWACAFAEVETGLDIQEERKGNYERLSRRFFHPEEVQWLELNGYEYFCRMWTYKESYVKYLGVGLSQGLDYFSVVSGTGCEGKPSTLEQDQGTMEAQIVAGAADVWQREVPFQDDCWMVITAKEEQDVLLGEL